MVASWFSSMVRALASQAKPPPMFDCQEPIFFLVTLLIFPATAVFAVNGVNLCSSCLRLLSHLCMFLVDRIQTMLVRSSVVQLVPVSVTTSGVAWAQTARAVAVSLLLKHCLQ